MKKKFMKMNKIQGFTLLEVIVSLSLLLLLVLLLARIFDMASETHSRIRHRNERNYNAKTILDQISREIKKSIPYYNDISAPVGPSNNDSYGPMIFKAGVGNRSGWVGGPGGARSIGDELFFIAPWTANAGQVSDLVEIGYYLDRGSDAVSHADNVLRRCAITDTSANYDYDTSKKWPDNNTYDELAVGVTSFTIEWYGLAWNNIEFLARNDNALVNKTPRAIRITIEIIDPEDAIKFAGDTGLGGKIEQLTQTFTTVINLKNCPGF